MRMAQTRCSDSWVLAAALFVAATCLWPRFGLGQWEPETALDLIEQPAVVAVASDASRIAVAGPNSVELVDFPGQVVDGFVFGAMPEGCCVRDLAFIGDIVLIARSPSWDDREGAGGTLGGLYAWAGDPDRPPVDLPVGGCTEIAVAALTDQFATACATAVQLWQSPDDTSPQTIYDGPVEALALDTSGSLLAIADRAGDDEAAAPNRLRLLELGDVPREVTSTEIHEADIVQLGFLADGSIWSLDADGVVYVTEQAGMRSRLITTNGPLSEEGTIPSRVTVSQDGQLMAGNFRGVDGNVLLDMGSGQSVVSDAGIPMRGSGHWAFDGAGAVLWSGRPPTYPTAVVRSFPLPPPPEPPKPVDTK